MPDLIHTLLYPLFLTMYFSITIYFISIIKIKPRNLILFTIIFFIIFSSKTTRKNKITIPMSINIILSKIDS